MRPGPNRAPVYVFHSCVRRHQNNKNTEMEMECKFWKTKGFMLCGPDADNVQQRGVARDGSQRHGRHRLPRQVAQLHPQAQGKRDTISHWQVKLRIWHLLLLEDLNKSIKD